METYEGAGRLDRKVEGLAANDELMRRAGEGRGLTRPELAVLLSTAKLALQDAIENSDLPDDPALASELRSEEHTSELQSLMRISYAVFCLKKKKKRRITEP